jgi:hypothetical protein
MTKLEAGLLIAIIGVIAAVAVVTLDWFMHRLRRARAERGKWMGT